MQKLGIYNFSKILNDIDAFSYIIKSRDIYGNPKNNITKIFFTWGWHDYEGFGEIFLYNNVIDVNNVTCRDSHLTISSNSKRQATKHYSTLYNEPGLISLFEYIINNN